MTREMTAFDHFQIATCCISEGKKQEASKHLRAAIRHIDHTRIDVNMRDDLAKLLNLCAS